VTFHKPVNPTDAAVATLKRLTTVSVQNSRNGPGWPYTRFLPGCSRTPTYLRIGFRNLNRFAVVKRERGTENITPTKALQVTGRHATARKLCVNSESGLSGFGNSCLS
jgi:hypothetical protein